MSPAVKKGSESSEGGGDKSYTLSEDSTSDSVEVDDKELVKYGDPVSLTQDQYDRASALDGIELVEASGQAAPSEQSDEQSQPEGE